jgi:hypothetical protein
MKKSMFIASAFAIAIVSAFAFKPAENSKFATRFKNIANCPQVNCSTSGTTTCNGFYQNQNCTSPISDGLVYTP